MTSRTLALFFLFALSAGRLYADDSMTKYEASFRKALAHLNYLKHQLKSEAPWHAAPSYGSATVHYQYQIEEEPKQT